jgi:hypothetical protein
MDNADGLEIPFNQFQNIANFKKLVDVRGEKGFLVKDGVVSEWHFTGFRYRDGVPYLYGPQALGVPLGEALLWPREKALATAADLIRALTLLTAPPENKIEISPDSVRFLNDGGILFLPAEVFRKLRLFSGDDDKARHSRLNDPYGEKPAENLSYAVGAVLYRVLTGSFPFDGATLDQVHARIRQRQAIPPHLLCPDLKKSISEIFVRFFEKKNPLTLAEWETAVTGWLADGFTEARSSAEATDMAGLRKRAEVKRERGLRRRAFIEKNGRALLIATVCAIGVGIIGGPILANVLAPRRTAGFTPRHVVESYYEAIDILDPDLMHACLQGLTGAGEVQRQEVLFVSNRQMTYYNKHDDRMRASQWERVGRPRIEAPQYIEGIVALTLTEVKSGPEWVYDAEYERWLHEPSPDAASPNPVQKAYHMKERLTLTKDNQGWLISDIVQLETKVVYESDKGYLPPPSPTPKAK